MLSSKHAAEVLSRKGINLCFKSRSKLAVRGFLISFYQGLAHFFQRTLKELLLEELLESLEIAGLNSAIKYAHELYSWHKTELAAALYAL